jgi:acylphosphatase
MIIQQAHVWISGFVQGVGFRRFVRHHALKFSLTGWVRNLPDNRVEVLFQGSKKQIEKVIAVCRKGAFLSEVKDISVEWENEQADAFISFEILR